MPRRSLSERKWATPLVWPLAQMLGRSPNRGPSPHNNSMTTAGQSPASHQAAEPLSRRQHGREALVRRHHLRRRHLHRRVKLISWLYVALARSPGS